MFDVADHQHSIDESCGENDEQTNHEQDSDQNQSSDRTDASDEPLYKGASIIVGISMTLLLAFVV